jgi:hypothetical protein
MVVGVGRNKLVVISTVLTRSWDVRGMPSVPGLCAESLESGWDGNPGRAERALGSGRQLPTKYVAERKRMGSWQARIPNECGPLEQRRLVSPSRRCWLGLVCRRPRVSDVVRSDGKSQRRPAGPDLAKMRRRGPVAPNSHGRTTRAPALSKEQERRRLTAPPSLSRRQPRARRRPDKGVEESRGAAGRPS